MSGTEVPSLAVLLLPDFLGLPFNPRAARYPVGEDLVRAGTLALVTGQSPSPSSWHTTQVVQLLTCDLLLSLRTALWQKQAGASQALGETYHASGAELAGFQRDLGSLRRLAHSFRLAYRKVRPILLLGRVDRDVRTEPSSGVESWSRLTGQALGWVPFIPLFGSCCVCPTLERGSEQSTQHRQASRDLALPVNTREREGAPSLCEDMGKATREHC